MKAASSSDGVAASAGMGIGAANRCASCESSAGSRRSSRASASTTKSLAANTWFAASRIAAEEFLSNNAVDGALSSSAASARSPASFTNDMPRF
jgi:hypothetical protein